MASKKQILFIVTSCDTLGKSGKPTGYYLPELAHPYEFLSQHYDITVASIKGGVCPMDPVSKEQFAEDPICKQFLANPVAQKSVNESIKLENVQDVSKYSAVVYPGGHGPMFDIATDEKSMNICTSVYENGGVVASVCHGPAGIANVKLSNGEYLVKGKKVTCFSNDEEDAIDYTQFMPFMLETTLIEHGASFEKASNLWEAHVTVDGKLVTGQNPASSEPLAKAVHDLLKN